jgi:hypothetical protein
LVKNSPTQKDYDHVTLILKEAAKHGLEIEIKNTAEKTIKDNPNISIVSAYQHAFEDWIK